MANAVFDKNTGEKIADSQKEFAAKVIRDILKEYNSDNKTKDEIYQDCINKLKKEGLNIKTIILNDSGVPKENIVFNGKDEEKNDVIISVNDNINQNNESIWGTLTKIWSEKHNGQEVTTNPSQNTTTPSPSQNKPQISSQVPTEISLDILNLIVYGAPGTGKSWKINESLKNGKKIGYVANDGVFRTTFHPDTDYSIFVGCYKPSMSQNNDIVYEFVPQIFLKAYMKAWEEYLKVNSQSNEDNLENKIPNYKHVYLIIEEINRGNCAQIFGDIFQLLDRDEKGFSEYGIIPDQDIKDYYLKNNYPWNKIKDELIKNNKIQQSSNEFYLAFPPNFHIWATMNTSDQSLYPMDSAFKRRWDWEYVKIDPKNKSKLAKNLDFYTSKSWPEVIEAINKMIKVKTKSADKQIGDYFIKTKNSQDITFEDFRNKVLFYLFNDVFKDNYNFGKDFFGNNNDNDDFLFEDLLNKEDNEQKTIVNNWFNKILGIQPKSTTPVNTDDSDNQDGQQTDSNNQDGQQTGPSTPN